MAEKCSSKKMHLLILGIVLCRARTTLRVGGRMRDSLSILENRLKAIMMIVLRTKVGSLGLSINCSCSLFL